MKKYIFGAVFAFVLLASPVFTQAAGLTSAQIDSIIMILSSFGAEQGVIDNVKESLTGTVSTQSSGAFCYTFNTDLTFGSGAVEVDALTTALSKEIPSYTPNKGATNTFTEDIAAVVVQFQAKYGITQTGYVGPITRAKLNKLYGCSGQSSVTEDTLAPTVTLIAPASVAQNTSATITWSSTNATSCTISGDQIVSVYDGPTKGSIESSKLSSTAIVTVKCTGPDGKYSYKSATINVAAAPATTASITTLTVPTSVVSGTKATVSWSTKDALYCSLTTGSNTDYSAGTAPLSGTKQTDPVTATKSVKLSCWGADGAVVTKSATIGVTATSVTPAPAITITAPTSVVKNGLATVSWSSTNATVCEPSGDDFDFYTAGYAPSGSSTSNIDKPTTYIVKCTGAGGTTTKSVTVGVTNPVLTTASITTLTVPTSVVSGTKATVSWSTKDALYCSLTTGSNTDYSAGTAPLSGTKQTDPVTATKSVKLSCWGADGAVVTKSATIGVTPAQVSCTVYVCTDEYTPYLNESDCLAACAGWGECKAETSTKPAVCSGPVSLGNSAKNQTASAFNAFQSVKAPTVSKTQVASFSYVWNNDLQIGSSFSADVTALQTALTKEGVYTGELTGGYYDQTYISVKAFQQKYGINPTGYVGLQTRAKLNELY